MVDDCFTDMLSYWLSRPNPPPTTAVLIDALKSPTVGHWDIAKEVELWLDATISEYRTTTSLSTFKGCYSRQNI